MNKKYIKKNQNLFQNKRRRKNNFFENQESSQEESYKEEDGFKILEKTQEEDILVKLQIIIKSIII